METKKPNRLHWVRSLGSGRLGGCIVEHMWGGTEVESTNDDAVLFRKGSTVVSPSQRTTDPPALDVGAGFRLAMWVDKEWIWE